MTPVSTSVIAAAAPAEAAPCRSARDMIDAIRAVRLAQAEAIGALCVSHARSGAPLALADLATATGILAGLDLAAEVLERALVGDAA